MLSTRKNLVLCLLVSIAAIPSTRGSQVRANSRGSNNSSKDAASTFNVLNNTVRVTVFDTTTSHTTCESDRCPSVSSKMLSSNPGTEAILTATNQTLYTANLTSGQTQLTQAWINTSPAEDYSTALLGGANVTIQPANNTEAYTCICAGTIARTK